MKTYTKEDLSGEFLESDNLEESLESKRVRGRKAIKNLGGEDLGFKEDDKEEEAGLGVESFETEAMGERDDHRDGGRKKKTERQK